MAGDNPKTGHGAKIDRKYEQAIAALLSQPTIEAAAKACQISESTLWRWMQEPSFNTAYQEARGQVLAQAVAKLHAASTEAVETLRAALSAPESAVRVRAALGILDQAYKGREMLDLDRRIAAIEVSLQHQSTVSGRRDRL